jgi:hypothetical protein
MKPCIFLIIILFIFSSCKNTWDSEAKDMFHQSCMEDAVTWAPSKDKAKVYCDCVLEKVMAKYPEMNDALEHMDSVIADPNIRSCKASIQ